jgi:hypothetical protein
MPNAAALAAFLVAQLASPNPSASPPAPAPASSAAPVFAPLPLHVAIDAATLRDLPRRSVDATDEHGKTSRYDGIALRDILTKANVPGGHAIRGKAMLDVVVVAAADGYRVVFDLPELDPAFTDRVVLLADMRDGAPLSAHDGPYQLIVPGDKHEARWERQVIALDVERIP